MCLYDQSLVALAFLWEELSQQPFYKNLTKKAQFFEGCAWFEFNNLGLTLVWPWNVTPVMECTSVAKGLKLKVKKFFWANSYVCWSYREKAGRRRGRVLHPIMNRVKIKQMSYHLKKFSTLTLFWLIIETYLNCLTVSELTSLTSANGNYNEARYFQRTTKENIYIYIEREREREIDIDR